MSVTTFSSGFCHVCDAFSLRFLSRLWEGDEGSESKFLPYILQHFLSGRASQNKRLCIEIKVNERNKGLDIEFRLSIEIRIKDSKEDLRIVGSV
jgi:hypothetical protein